MPSGVWAGAFMLYVCMTTLLDVVCFAEFYEEQCSTANDYVLQEACVERTEPASSQPQQDTKKIND